MVNSIFNYFAFLYFIYHLFHFALFKAESLYRYSIIAARNNIFNSNSQTTNDDSLVKYVHEVMSVI